MILLGMDFALYYTSSVLRSPMAALLQPHRKDLRIIKHQKWALGLMLRY